MKALFVDHAYHNSTKSSFFMVDLLKNNFDIDVLLVDPQEENLEQKLNQSKLVKYDFIVLWQIDWLATYFLHLGFKVIVIPMFDGSATLDSIHWRSARDALFINFSLSLHNIITDAGCESIYVRYFPEKNYGNNLITPRFSLKHKPTAFFWERRPDTMLNTSEICRLLGEAISHLHVHQAPDPGLSPSQIPEKLPFTVSTSTWFSRGEQYLECVCEHDIYVAPRYTEGIGMGFLEAMSLGRIVIAHDAPTHSEYIKNNHNGILFNAFRKDVINKTQKEFFKIGENAAADAKAMRKSWSDFYQKIIINRVRSYVENKSINVLKRTTNNLSSSAMLRKLGCAHRDWNGYYRFLKELEKKEVSQVVEHIMAEVSKLELSKNYDLAKKLLSEKIMEYDKESPYFIFYNLLEARENYHRS